MAPAKKFHDEAWLTWKYTHCVGSIEAIIVNHSQKIVLDTPINWVLDYAVMLPPLEF